jgi:hypothetical protein
MNQGASKATLAQWVSFALKRALSSDNIWKGFKNTGILPLNKKAVDVLLAPSQPFGRGQPSAHTGEGGSKEELGESNGELGCSRKGGPGHVEQVQHKTEEGGGIALHLRCTSRSWQLHLLSLQL